MDSEFRRDPWRELRRAPAWLVFASTWVVLLAGGARLFHGAGTNVSTTVRRMANLLQVSSPFGRAMETVDQVAMYQTLFPILLEKKATRASDGYLDNIIAACAEGYAFPTNLDRDQPVNGMSPETQSDLVRRALGEAISVEELSERLAAQVNRTLSH